MVATKEVLCQQIEDFLFDEQENMSMTVANNWVRYCERPVKMEMEEIVDSSDVLDEQDKFRRA
jgi:hypothetical protein